MGMRSRLILHWQRMSIRTFGAGAMWIAQMMIIFQICWDRQRAQKEQIRRKRNDIFLYLFFVFVLIFFLKMKVIKNDLILFWRFRCCIAEMRLIIFPNNTTLSIFVYFIPLFFDYLDGALFVCSFPISFAHNLFFVFL